MRIMTITDSPYLNSGLARVHKKVLEGLIDNGHEVIPCVWFGYSDEDMSKVYAGKEPQPLYFNYKGEHRMYCIPKSPVKHAAPATMDAIETIKPDIVLTIGDYWSFIHIKSIKEKLDYSFKWFGYITIEEDNIDLKWKQIFALMDYVAVPSIAGVKALSKINIEATYIPYGVDRNIFYKFPEEKRLELKKDRNICGKVRFLTIAQNSYRKNLPSLLFAAREIKEKYPSIYENISLHIHTNITANSPYEVYVYDLLSLAEQLKVEEVISFPMVDSSIFSKNYPKDNYMANEMNAADFIIAPSSSEGFGLPILEGMSCGIPCIGASNTAIREHIEENRGIPIATKEEIFPPDKIVNAVDLNSLVKGMFLGSRLIEDRKGLYQDMSSACEKYAITRSWEGMNEKIMELVNEVPEIIHLPIEVIN